VTTVRVHVTVSGSVQGVFFRATCARRARELGVRGWVRNLPDGRVEAAFEGVEDSVQAMIGWCHEGPSGARVTSVDIERIPVEGEVGFAIVGR
jgi:acylphosphatase